MNAPTIQDIERADHGQLRVLMNDPACVLVGAELVAISRRLVGWMQGQTQPRLLPMPPVVSTSATSAVTATAVTSPTPKPQPKPAPESEGADYFKSLFK